MNTYVWIWAVILAVCVIIELLTVGLTTIWLAAGALGALIAACLNASVALQIILFIIVSAVLLIFTRPVLIKKMNLGKEKTNIDSIIGQTGIVTAPISEFDTGLVKAGGQIWSALSADQNKIDAGEKIIVDRVEGVKLIVRPYHDKN
jgi:membrane protein implicated in regulation of membrane protease activity